MGRAEWTTHDELANTLHNRIEYDGDLLGIGVVERFAIPQRALLLDTDVGNVLWDCVGVVTPAAIDEIARRGGIDLIAISHPHFYSAMVEWSDAFGGAPILLHADDREWIRRPSAAIECWRGDDHVLSPTVRLLHLPGHFPGSSALHWSAAPGGRRALLSGDSLHVAADRRHVSVMHSVPNFVPVGRAVIHDLRGRLDGVEIDDVYGFTWGLNVIGGAAPRSTSRSTATSHPFTDREHTRSHRPRKRAFTWCQTRRERAATGLTRQTRFTSCLTPREPVQAARGGRRLMLGWVIQVEPSGLVQVTVRSGVIDRFQRPSWTRWWCCSHSGSMLSTTVLPPVRTSRRDGSGTSRSHRAVRVRARCVHRSEHPALGTVASAVR